MWWVCAPDNEWIEVELAPIPQYIIDQERAIEKLKETIHRLEKRNGKKTNKKDKLTLTSLEAKLNKDMEDQRS